MSSKILYSTKLFLPRRLTLAMNKTAAVNGKKSKGRYAGTWLSKSAYARLKAIGKRQRLSVARMLEEAVRRILEEGEVRF